MTRKPSAIFNMSEMTEIAVAWWVSNELATLPPQDWLAIIHRNRGEQKWTELLVEPDDIM